MASLPGFRALVSLCRNALSSFSRASTRSDGGVPALHSDDEERIYAIVQEHGGRARQQAIVEELDWSPSKVSRELSRMESRGSIGRITTGREKIVVLPELVSSPPDAARDSDQR